MFIRVVQPRVCSFCLQFTLQKIMKAYRATRSFSKTLHCHYKTLNLPSDCSMEDIKTQYLSLAKKYHPDVAQEATDPSRFQSIKKAYEVLSNEQSRLSYDVQQGVQSTWKYRNRYDKTFGENEQDYQKYQKVNGEQLKQKKSKDEEIYKYFEEKYFKNHDYFTKFEDEQENLFRLTPQMKEEKQKRRRAKEAQYEEFYAKTANAYLSKKGELKYTGRHHMAMYTLYEFRLPIVFAFLGVTVYSCVEALQERGRKKEKIGKATQVSQGKGLIVKNLPLNIV